MSCTRLGALTLTLVLPGALLAQGFEGRITAEMAGMPGQAGSAVVILTKGGKSRMEMNAGGMDMYMIMDGQAGTMLSVIPAQRMYMKMNLNDAAQAMGGARSQTPPKITRTGKHETVAGKDCEHILMTTERGEMDMCVAKGMGFFMGPGGGPMSRGPSMPLGYEDLMREFKDGFFPLRIEMVEGAKRTQFLNVKTIEPQRLDAALFAPPAGFQEMTMPPGMGRP
jgi:hypothetical protein